MELNEYQEKAMHTCMDTCDNFSYMMLNLVGEVGEFAGKVAKMIRKDCVAIGHHEETDQTEQNELFPTCCFDKWNEIGDELKKEAGDILWQLSGLCKVLGWSLEEVAQGNLDKLASRQQRGVIDGNGDNR